MGVTENAGPKCRSSSELERKLHKNMLATCSLMYIQLFFIAYHIKKCFWLQFNRSEPCWSSGCVRNRHGSGTKYRLSRCKHCIKMLPTSGRFRPMKFKQHRKNSLNIPKQHLAPHERRLNAHNLRYQKQDRFWIGWFRILTTQVDSSTCQLRKIISQTFGPVGDSSAE